MIKKIDSFSKNVFFVFISTSLVNVSNLIYQLLIAHRLNLADFSAFNSLLSISVIFSTPLSAFQSVLVRYIAEFNGQNKSAQIKILLKSLLKYAFTGALITFFLFSAASFSILNKLKIDSTVCGYMLAALLALSWVTPIAMGGIQGLELFKWFSSISVATTVLKLVLAFMFIQMGFNIIGALGGFLCAAAITVFISFLPLRRILGNLNPHLEKGGQERFFRTNFKEMFVYTLPVLLSYFCFANLINMDMILVKYYFSSNESGVYSLAQMVGKIFLFLPGAVAIVMFPRISNLNAKKENTVSTLKLSLVYAGLLCAAACFIFNLFPCFFLKILTGRAPIEAVVLGRLFSVSMVFFALLLILITYFISMKDLRFIKYLVLFTVLQFIGIVLFHKDLIHVQIALCVSAIALFFTHLALLIKPSAFSFQKKI